VTKNGWLRLVLTGGLTFLPQGSITWTLNPILFRELGSFAEHIYNLREYELTDLQIVAISV